MGEEQAVKSKRDEFTERLRAKYPDEAFDDDDALFGRIGADYDQYDKSLGEYKDREGKLADMFAQDPRSARLVMAMKDGEDPTVTLIRMYGTELKDALDDPEKQEEFAKANREYMQRVSEEKEYEKQWGENIEESLREVERVQTEQGLSDDDVDGALAWLFTTAKEIMLGKISPEALSMAIKAKNYDVDVEQAGAEGEVRGKNARVTEELRRPQGDGTAPLAGKNGVEGDERPKTIFDLARAAQ